MTRRSPSAISLVFPSRRLDGSIGKVDDATNDVGGSFIVVDTGPWIFGKKVLLPAGVISGLISTRRRCLSIARRSRSRTRRSTTRIATVMRPIATATATSSAATTAAAAPATATTTDARRLKRHRCQGRKPERTRRSFADSHLFASDRRSPQTLVVDALATAPDDRTRNASHAAAQRAQG